MGADETQHWSRTRVISYSARYSHAFAEWIEEDPAEVIPFQKAQLFMMAKTDGTHMSSLEVNGGVPGPFELQPESFIDGSATTFAPSPLDAMRSECGHGLGRLDDLIGVRG